MPKTPLRPFRAAAVLAAIAFVGATASAAHAQGGAESADVRFFFTLPGQTAPITSLTTAANGSFAVSVWYSSTAFAHDTLDVFVGFDRSTAEGLDAVPLDNSVSLAGTPETALTNPNAAFTAPSAALGGGTGAAAGAPRPYGLDVILQPNVTPRTGSAATRLFDLAFTAAGLAPGGSYTLRFHDAGPGAVEFSSYLAGPSATPGATDYARPGIAGAGMLQVTRPGAAAVPEPAAGVLALCGATLPAAHVLARRRRRQAVRV
jgi:hypothetical protein